MPAVLCFPRELSRHLFDHPGLGGGRGIIRGSSPEPEVKPPIPESECSTAVDCASNILTFPVSVVE